MKGTALISGASGGIGRELAGLFARDGYDLVLVSRGEKQLDAIKVELEQGCGVSVLCIARDLSEEDAAQAVFDTVAASGRSVDVLVNNAGFGDYAPFLESDWETQRNLVQLNIVSLMQMTRLFAPPMAQRRSGRILNVASTAAFQPGPYMASYYASKAFVLSFSESLAAELDGSGVTVTALCPGPTQTGFGSRSSLDDSKLFAKLKVARSSDVAAFGYDALMRGKVVAVHGAQNRFIVFLLRLSPRGLVRRVMRSIQGRKD
jgi:Short-chain dehydrogenases of various substrate specificities